MAISSGTLLRPVCRIWGLSRRTMLRQLRGTRRQHARGFFTEPLARELAAEQPADLILANNVFAHARTQ